MRFAAAPGTGEGLGAHARPRGGAVSTRSRGRAGSVPGVAGCGRTEDPAGPAGARTGSGAGVQTGCAFSWPWVLRRAATLGSGLDAWPPWTRASSERANSGGQRRLSLRTVWPGAVRRLLESDQARSCGEQTGPPYPRPTSPSRPVGSQRLWFGEPACGHRSYTRVGPPCELAACPPHRRPWGREPGSLLPTKQRYLAHSALGNISCNEPWKLCTGRHRGRLCSPREWQPPECAVDNRSNCAWQPFSLVVYCPFRAEAPLGTQVGHAAPYFLL